MAGIRIVAKTERGEKALLQHLKEKRTAPIQQRILFKQLYEEMVESESPLTVSIMHRRPDVASVLPFESLRVPIVDAMSKNGAKERKDYSLVKV